MEGELSKERVKKLRRNPRLLFLGKLCMQFGATYAVTTLFYQYRGVTLDQIFFLSIVWSIVALIVEVPTGYLADYFGRKQALLLGAAIFVIGQVIAWNAVGFRDFIVVFILTSFSFACFSGTEEALLYDSLKEIGEETHMTHHNGRLWAAKQIMKIFIPGIGAWIAKDLVDWQFRVLIGVDIAGACIAMLVYSFLIEPRHTEAVAKKEEGIFRQSVQTIRRDRFLFQYALNKLLIFIAGFILWRVYQSYFVEVGIDGFWLGLFYILMNIALSFGHWKMGAWEKRLGTFRILSGTIVLLLLCFAVLIFVQDPVAIFIACLLGIVFTALRQSVFAHAVNERIASRSRATTLSNLNLLKSVLDIPILFLTGWLAVRDPRYVFVIGAILCVIVLLAFPLRQEKRVLMAIPS